MRTASWAALPPEAQVVQAVCQRHTRPLNLSRRVSDLFKGHIASGIIFPIDDQNSVMPLPSRRPFGVQVGKISGICREQNQTIGNGIAHMLFVGNSTGSNSSGRNHVMPTLLQQTDKSIRIEIIV